MRGHGMDFVSQCEQKAQAHFSIPSLRPAQKEVLSLLEKKQHVLATLPTGAGKTLLYALPSLVFQEGTVLVISPLISLMRDQARRMEQAKIPCVILTSEQTDEELAKAKQILKQQQAKIAFVSPERFVLPSFLSLVSKIKISMIVVDEAHCVVSWGHQFRPEYAEIGKYLQQLNSKYILALTATASSQSRQDIIHKVFPSPQSVSEFTSLPLAPHIHVKSIRAFSQNEQWDKLVEILQKTTSHKSIVYFPTRKMCEDFSKKLQKLNIHAIAYHAGLERKERQMAETYVHASSRKVVICATTAFGMGVDVSGIELVVVYGFPGNIEEFFQMLGRAGRSGEASQGILIWTGSDPVKRQLQFQSAFPLPSKLLVCASHLASVFPKNIGESVVIDKKTLMQTLHSNKHIQHEREVDGIFSALRICDAVEEIPNHYSYLQVNVLNQNNLDKLLLELPNTPTKRGKVLHALKEILPSEFSAIPGGIGSCLLNYLIEVSQLSWSTVEQVLIYYKEQNIMSYKVVSSQRENTFVILKNNYLSLQKNLNKYICARDHFQKSLQHLENLATSTTCRLMSSFQFFSARKLQGATKNSYFCQQCDICNKRQKESLSVLQN